MKRTKIMLISVCSESRIKVARESLMGNVGTVTSYLYVSIALAKSRNRH